MNIDDKKPGSGYSALKGVDPSQMDVILQELEASEAMLPTDECLQPPELLNVEDLGAGRRLHAENCQFCAPMLSLARLTPERAQLLAVQSMRKAGLGV